MAWKIEFAAGVEKDLRNIGPENARRILRYLREQIAALEDPRTLGAPLHGPVLGAFWKYRVGDYRVVASIEDRAVTILIVRVGHRREVYR